MIKIGCCGFPVSKKKYFENFNVVEIQQTFYKLIDIETIKKWRKEAPKDFEFTFKAFQGLTHTIKSPTWKRSGLSKEELKKLEKYVGNLKWNKVTQEYWEKMVEYSKVLNSKIVVIQLPSSFEDNEENIRNVIEFLENASNEIKIALELRGWKKENIKKIVEKYEIIDVVDILNEEPFSKILYTRLHGKVENKKIIYKYDYSKEELKKIYEKVKKYKEAYVMFNNVYMFKNALELKSFL
ncbi:MAG: DUF72 domain-containing protein [Candidatus Aenigmatarchaeota archaeon]